jgi:hypothetical protein
VFQQPPSCISDVLYDQSLQFESLYAIDSNTSEFSGRALVASWAVHIGLEYEGELALDKAHVGQLATSSFMGQANNLIFVGGTGTGKTHVASALAVPAIHQAKRARF